MGRRLGSHGAPRILRSRSVQRRCAPDSVLLEPRLPVLGIQRTMTKTSIRLLVVYDPYLSPKKRSAFSVVVRANSSMLTPRSFAIASAVMRTKAGSHRLPR
jgi:hypothetical protein